MLQQIRDKSGSKFFYSLLMIMIIGGMAFFGIGDYSFGGSQPYVAKVGDELITETEFAQRLQENQRQMRSMMGQSFNAKMFDTPTYRRQLLDQMIDEELVTQAGAAAGMAVSDKKLSEEIAKTPAFQTDGKFDDKLYEQIVKDRLGMSVTQFQERMRHDMSLRELPAQINATALVTPRDVDTFVRLRDQLRSFRYLTLPAPTAAPEAISDEALKQYFDGHASNYVVPEMVSIEYVELDGNSLRAAAAPIDEAELRKHYDDQSQRFGTKEQRLASHVLVEVAANADADAEKAAKQRIDALAAEIAAGKPFAEVAEASSDDVGTKSSGGDLGWIEQGSLEPVFEAELFKLEAGTVSAPVRTPEGYHLIQLREVRPAAMKSFEEVRAELEAEIQEERRLSRLAELQDKLFDAADQSSGTLEPLAKAIDAQLKTSEFFSSSNGSGIAASPEVRDAAFSPEVKDDGLTSEPIDLGNERVVVLRLAERKPAQQRNFEDAKEEVRSALLVEANQKTARENADAALKRLLAAESISSIATSVGAAVVEAADTGRQGMTHDTALVSEAFKMARPSEGAVTHGLAKLDDTRYALVELYSVVDGDPSKLDDAARTAAREQLKQELAATEAEAFRKALRDRTDIRVDETKI